MSPENVFMSVSAGAGVALDFPREYQPLKSLDLCSNILENVKVPILFRNVPLLLVGDGPFPLVWLAGPVDPRQEKWRWVVEKSISRSTMINVDVDGSTATVQVFAGKSQVLRVGADGPGQAKVTELDLRPLGSRVQGSSVGLDIGGTKMSGNRFVGGRAAISLA